jgi:hypothetical protein
MTSRRKIGLPPQEFLRSSPLSSFLDPKAHQDHAAEGDEEAEQFEQGKALDPLHLSGEGACPTWSVPLSSSVRRDEQAFPHHAPLLLSPPARVRRARSHNLQARSRVARSREMGATVGRDLVRWKRAGGERLEHTEQDWYFKQGVPWIGAVFAPSDSPKRPCSMSSPPLRSM